MEKAESTITLDKENGKKFKERLKEWYIEHIANNGESIRKAYDAKTTVQNTAGGVAFGIFFPEFAPLIPAIQSANKYKNNVEYETVKKLIHRSLDIKPEELNVKPASKGLDCLEDGTLEKISGDVAKTYASQAKSSMEAKGRSR